MRIEMFKYWYSKHSKWQTSSRVSQVQMSEFVPWTVILICCSCKYSPGIFSWRSLVIWCGAAQAQKVLHSCLHRAAQWPVPIKTAGWGSPPDWLRKVFHLALVTRLQPWDTLKDNKPVWHILKWPGEFRRAPLWDMSGKTHCWSGLAFTVSL